MPIKPENKNRYPKDWKEISIRIRFDRAKNKCEVCGISNYMVQRFNVVDESFQISHYNWNGEDTYAEARRHCDHINDWCADGEGKWSVVVLTVAHLDHNPENCADDNLKAMCQRCHNRYDRQHRNETRNSSKKQMNLFS